MIRFIQLYSRLDATTKTNAKISALASYFGEASAGDAAWATYFLTGRRLAQCVPTKFLRQWAAEAAQIPDWLFDESYQVVGDLAETISLIVPPATQKLDGSLSFWVESEIRPLRKLDESEQKRRILDIWNRANAEQRFVVMKLITGAFRVGVSKGLVTKAIAQQFELPVDVVSHRLMGDWEPSAEFFARVVDPDVTDTSNSQPYPFCLAHALDPQAGPHGLGPISEYMAEWKWDGIRGQVIRRKGSTYIWSRGEELMEARWPEIEEAAQKLPDGTVLDGEILACASNGQVLSFAKLQRRIGRKKVGKKLLKEVPVVFQAFDLLERGGADLRALPLHARRKMLEELLADIDGSVIRPTELLSESSWQALATQRAASRELNSEGLMLKHRDRFYDVGRVRGTWWKWKIEPHTIDAVLIYAQRGHGKRASLYTDYTFGLWHQGELVPFAKAYSGLSDAEIRDVDRFIRRNTKESFGPVRSVTPELVMELAFEGLSRSTRHKSGIATRFPRIVRWRLDKKPPDANSLDDLLQLLPAEEKA